MKRLLILALLILAACSAPGPTAQPTQGISAPIGPTVTPVVAWHTHCSFGGGPVANCTPVVIATTVLTTTATKAATTIVTPTATLIQPTNPPGTSIPTITATRTPTSTVTPAAPSATPLPTITPVPTTQPGVAIRPYPSAPLCLDQGGEHDTAHFHTLWNERLGCHYNHEHGVNPFTAQVAAVFPDFDIKSLGCGMEVNHCSPSSSRENTNSVSGGKHEGWKWDVNLASYLGCGGFEGVPTGVNAAVLGYHTFGNYAIEAEGRTHSAMGVLRQCKASTGASDYGYVYTVGLQDYGQRTVPYQGDIMPYPDTPGSPYDPPRGAYISFDCVGQKLASSPPERGACRDSLASVLSRNSNANSIWTSKLTGDGRASLAATANKLFQILFRLRDTFQLVEWTRLGANGIPTYPFTFKYLCSTDGGVTYTPLVGCRYNNTTTHVHEIFGTIPAAWDNVPGDTDTRVGRITGSFLTDRYGNRVAEGLCIIPNMSCFRTVLIRAFVGNYGSQMIDGKLAQFGMEAQPERDIYFCGTVVCAEDSVGAKASGWVGPAN